MNGLFLHLCKPGGHLLRSGHAPLTPDPHLRPLLDLVGKWFLARHVLASGGKNQSRGLVLNRSGSEDPLGRLGPAARKSADVQQGNRAHVSFFMLMREREVRGQQAASQKHEGKHKK